MTQSAPFGILPISHWTTGHFVSLSTFFRLRLFGAFSEPDFAIALDKLRFTNHFVVGIRGRFRTARLFAALLFVHLCNGVFTRDHQTSCLLLSFYSYCRHVSICLKQDASSLTSPTMMMICYYFLYCPWCSTLLSNLSSSQKSLREEAYLLVLGRPPSLPWRRPFTSIPA